MIVSTPGTHPVELNVAGRHFTLSRHSSGWAWTHLSEGEIGIVAESQVIFPAAGEALEDLLEYVSGLTGAELNNGSSG